jgi:putative molybdenum carrier protein
MKTGRLHRKYTELEKIISGGQTGVDRGALDAALDAGFPCGGSCPRGRRAEDGAIPDRYPLTELETTNYRTRTKRNVMDADGTLIIFFGELSGGTRETLRIAEDVGKPVLTLDASAKASLTAAVEAAAFVEHHAIAVLNVAGPRESSGRGAADYARELISAMLLRLRPGAHS